MSTPQIKTANEIGLDRLRTTVDAIEKGIKGEFDSKPSKEVLSPISKEHMESVLANIQANQELVRMYTESAKLGADNLAGGALPMLKIHTTNKSVGNVLPDGTEPNNGWFFHSSTLKQYESPICHILTVSKGYKSEGMTDQKTGKKNEPQFNQLVGGLLIDGTNYVPFVMFMSGLKLTRFWSFAEEASQYTHAKPMPIPMFTLTVKLGVTRQAHDYGSSFVPTFEIVKEGDAPLLVSDPKTFMFLKQSVERMQATIESYINQKAIGGDVSEAIGESEQV